jgi:microcystin-dependent protein
MVGFNFPPRGWAFLDGQILPINQNQSLYSLLGTTYGGDGRSTFALPDLRGRTPLHPGDEHRLGTKSGAESVTLTTAQIAAHTHDVKAAQGVSNSDTPTNALFADETDPDLAYRNLEAATKTPLRSGTLANAGGGQAHENMQPYITLNFCIALQGLFPSRN